MIYLASPYSHPDPAIREQRFRDVCRAAASLKRAGNLVLCPIAHGHPIAEFGLPTDWQFWQAFDERMIAACDEVVVLMLDGWEKSVGIVAEVGIANRLGKPVSYLEPESHDRTTHQTLQGRLVSLSRGTRAGRASRRGWPVRTCFPLG